MRAVDLDSKDTTSRAPRGRFVQPRDRQPRGTDADDNARDQFQVTGADRVRGGGLPPAMLHRPFLFEALVTRNTCRRAPSNPCPCSKYDN
jgi:hypothetical protein